VYKRQAQDSPLIDIYSEGMEIIEVFEELGFEFVRTEFDILSRNDNQEESIRTLSSLYEYYAFVNFAASSMVDVELNVYTRSRGDDEFELVGTGKALEDNLSVLTVKITPEETKDYIFEVKCNQFKNRSNVGRYMLTIGHMGEIDKKELDVRNEEKKSGINTYRASSYVKFEKGIKNNKVINNLRVYDPCILELSSGKVKFITEGKVEEYYFIGEVEDGDDNIVSLQVLDGNGVRVTLDVDRNTGEITIYKKKDNKTIEGMILKMEN